MFCWDLHGFIMLLCCYTEGVELYSGHIYAVFCLIWKALTVHMPFLMHACLLLLAGRVQQQIWTNELQPA